jgi:hypothetical protein
MRVVAAVASRSMTSLVMSGHLDARDGLNPTRALILQAYDALRRCYEPPRIGTPQVAGDARASGSGRPCMESWLGRAEVSFGPAVVSLGLLVANHGLAVANTDWPR